MNKITLAGIELEPIEEGPFRIKSLGWICYPFRVIGPGDVLRNELSKIIGEKLYGKTIRGVESYAVEHQTGKTVSLAVGTEEEAEMRQNVKEIHDDIPMFTVSLKKFLIKKDTLGGKRGGSHWKRMKESKTAGAYLPVYISAKNLAEFITPELKEKLTNPIPYIAKNKKTGNGLLADVLP